jgi:hypothetical protein
MLQNTWKCLCFFKSRNLHNPRTLTLIHSVFCLTTSPKPLPKTVHSNTTIYKLHITTFLPIAHRSKKRGGMEWIKLAQSSFNRQPNKMLLPLTTHKNIFNHGSGIAEESQTNIYIYIYIHTHTHTHARAQAHTHARTHTHTHRVEPLLSRLRITVNSINRASHRYAVPLHFQCAGGVVSG